MQSVTTPTKRPRIMVDMSATLIHHGHIRLLKKAAELGDVVVALTSDAEVKSKKGYTPELNFAERKEILEAVKYVTEVRRGGDEYVDFLVGTRGAGGDVEALKRQKCVRCRRRSQYDTMRRTNVGSPRP